MHVHAQPRLQSRLTGFRHNNNPGQEHIIRTEELHNACSFRLWILTCCQLQNKELPVYKLIWWKRAWEKDWEKYMQDKVRKVNLSWWNNETKIITAWQGKSGDKKWGENLWQTERRNVSDGVTWDGAQRKSEGGRWKEVCWDGPKKKCGTKKEWRSQMRRKVAWTGGRKVK